MSLISKEQIDELLTKLKTGSVLIKRKHDGEKYSRDFYLDKQENFVSYRRSEKTFSPPPRCKSFSFD